MTGLHPQTPVGGPSSSSGGPSSSSGGPSSSSGGPSSSGGGPSCSGRGPSSSSGGPSCSREVGGEEGSEQDPLDQAAACYDNVYFETSSSEEEEEEGGGDKVGAIILYLMLFSCICLSDNVPSVLGRRRKSACCGCACILHV